MNMTNFLFSFEGRINRTQYWLFNLAIFIIFTVPFILLGSGEESLDSPIALLFMLALIWPCLAVQCKRWHDTNKSGWWILINFIPLIGLWAFIENGFFAGDAGSNDYGNPPA